MLNDNIVVGFVVADVELATDCKSNAASTPQSSVTYMFLRLLLLILRHEPFFGMFDFNIFDVFKEKQRDIDGKVTEAIDALSQSSKLIEELETTLKERNERLLKIQKDYKDLSELLNVKAPQVEAISNKLRDILGETQKTERIVALTMHIGVGLLFFVLGVFASDWVKEAPSKFLSYFHSSAPAALPSHEQSKDISAPSPQ
jgi:hypothetical protein